MHRRAACFRDFPQRRYRAPAPLRMEARADGRRLDSISEAAGHEDLVPVRGESRMQPGHRTSTRTLRNSARTSVTPYNARGLSEGLPVRFQPSDAAPRGRRRRDHAYSLSRKPGGVRPRPRPTGRNRWQWYDSASILALSLQACLQFLEEHSVALCRVPGHPFRLAAVIA